MASAACLSACQAPYRCSSSRASSSRRPSAAVAALQRSASTQQSSSSSGSSIVSAGLPRRELLLGAAAAALGAALLPRPAAASGPVPKAYEDTAVKLVAALREAISADLSDAEERQVRRAAEPAKNLVREFLSRWKDSPLVEGQDSYRSLTDAIQQLGAFYQANGQRARLTPEVGQAILDTLDAAEAALPAQAEARSLLPFF